MNTTEQVVITGAGLVTALGKTPEENWEAICSGKSGIRPISGFDASGFSCRHAAEVGEIDPKSLGIHPRDARIMDTHAYLLLMAARNALKATGLDQAGFSAEEIGFYAGMGMVDYRTDDLLPAVLKSLGPDGALDYPAFYTGGYREIYPLWPLSMLNNITFCQVGIDLNIRGENAVFCPHAEAGAQAVTEGMRSIRERRDRAALAGGVSEKVSPLSLARLHLAGVAKNTIMDADAKCIPFAANGKGTIPGEGAAIIALELRDSADRRNVPYAAMISGYGHTCEPMEEGPAPSASAIATAMGRALEVASLQPEDIDLIIAHGDGTALSDRSEADAITAVFGKVKERVPVFSSKAALGNLLAASPAADIILGIQMIKEGIIPAVTYQTTDFLDSEEPGLVVGSSRAKHIKRVMVNCQSYEGQSASIIIEAVR